MKSRGRPHLPIGRTSQERRFLLSKFIYKDKERLFWAYCAQNQSRIVQAKLQLARHLREWADSPELGRPPRFKWSDKLLIVIEQNIDPQLTPRDIDEASGDFFKVARLLEEGIYAYSHS